jgi:hypothetical protein
VRIILTSRSAIKVFNDLLYLIQLDSSPDESQIISQEHLIHSPLVLDYIKANHGHHLFQSDVSNYSTNQSSCCLNDSFILNCDFLRILTIQRLFVEKLDGTDGFKICAIRVQKVIISVNLSTKQGM